MDNLTHRIYSLRMLAEIMQEYVGTCLCKKNKDVRKRFPYATYKSTANNRSFSGSEIMARSIRFRLYCALFRPNIRYALFRLILLNITQLKSIGKGAQHHNMHISAFFCNGTLCPSTQHCWRSVHVGL